MNATRLINDAQDHLNKFPPDYERANELFERAFRLEPKNSYVLSSYGEFMISIGDLQKGRVLIEESINIDPYDDYVKYFSLGQILEGEESLIIWERGIEVLQNKIHTLEAENNYSNSLSEKLCLLKNQLCSALCAISELYMTDLCDAENAETEIQKYLGWSEKINKDHFETLCCKLCYLKTIDNVDESKEYVSRIRELLYNNYNFNLEDKIEVENQPTLPEYYIRLNLSRTLIDLNETVLAEEILNSLLAEDEEDWQVWYLLSWCFLVSNNTKSSIESFSFFKTYGEKHIQDPELRKQFEIDLKNLKCNIENMRGYEKELVEKC